LLRRQRLVSDTGRNVRLYSRIKDRKSPLKGSRPSVPTGLIFLLLFAGNIVDLLVVLSNLSILGRFGDISRFTAFIHSFTDSENQPESSTID